MAIIGPRPLLVRYLDRYNDEQRHRHDVITAIPCAEAMIQTEDGNVSVGINVVVTSRNLDKLIEQYSFWNDKNLSFFEYDMFKDISFDVSVDYVVHAAGNAHPTTFNRDPVGTIWGNIKGTYNLLEYCKSCKGKRFLYVSSGEVYGQGDLSVEEFEEKYA